MGLKAGMVGLAMLALLVSAPGALASAASVRSGTTVVYQGDPSGDRVTLSRVVDRDGQAYYVLTDAGGISAGSGCAGRSGWR